MSTHFFTPWQDLIDLDALHARGFITLAPFLDAHLHTLRQEAKRATYRPARLVNDALRQDIRGDVISWIETDNADTAQSAYLQSLMELGLVLNRAFYCGISHIEGHFAQYQPKAGYNWHKDNPKGKNGRVFSCVLYLNPNWQTDQGGRLFLVDAAGQTQTIAPRFGTLALFDSRLLHKVERTTANRLSLTAWLRTHP